ncbi:hypothetical protein ACFE04_018094 [Oxalis oulophora]
MWQEWAKDEASLSSWPDAVSTVKNLYERGVSDYLFVPFWCDYLNFIQEYDTLVRNCTPDGIAKARSMFECAITAGKRKANSTSSKFIPPSTVLRSTLLAYKSWEAEQGTTLDAETSDLDGVPPKAASAYKKALEMYEEWFEQYRERMQEAEQLILTTLNFEIKVQHPYGPLTTVLSKLGLSQTVPMNLALNLSNDNRDLADEKPRIGAESVDKSRIRKISRLIYTNSILVVLALASNVVHKHWKSQRNDRNLTGKITLPAPSML